MSDRACGLWSTRRSVKTASGRGNSDQSLLLERISPIRHSRAVQYAALRAVIGPAAMHCTAVVPHHEVADRPAVLVDELPLCREGDQLLDQRPPRLDRPAD